MEVCVVTEWTMSKDLALDCGAWKSLFPSSYIGRDLLPPPPPFPHPPPLPPPFFFSFFSPPPSSPSPTLVPHCIKKREDAGPEDSVVKPAKNPTEETVEETVEEPAEEPSRFLPQAPRCRSPIFTLASPSPKSRYLISSLSLFLFPPSSSHLILSLSNPPFPKKGHLCPGRPGQEGRHPLRQKWSLSRHRRRDFCQQGRRCARFPQVQQRQD